SEPSVGDQKTRPSWVLAACISGACLAVSVGHLIWPERVDAILLGLLALGTLPWLAPYIKSLQLPGGWLLQFHKLERKVNEALGAAESATTMAETMAEVTLAEAARGAQPPPAVADADSPDKELEKLIDEYKTIRENMKPDRARTNKLDRVVARMI